MRLINTKKITSVLFAVLAITSIATASMTSLSASAEEKKMPVYSQFAVEHSTKSKCQSDKFAIVEHSISRKFQGSRCTSSSASDKRGIKRT